MFQGCRVEGYYYRVITFLRVPVGTHEAAVEFVGTSPTRELIALHVPFTGDEGRGGITIRDDDGTIVYRVDGEDYSGVGVGGGGGG